MGQGESKIRRLEPKKEDAAVLKWPTSIRRPGEERPTGEAGVEVGTTTEAQEDSPETNVEKLNRLESLYLEGTTADAYNYVQEVVFKTQLAESDRLRNMNPTEVLRQRQQKSKELEAKKKSRPDNPRYREMLHRARQKAGRELPDDILEAIEEGRLEELGFIGSSYAESDPVREAETNYARMLSENPVAMANFIAQAEKAGLDAIANKRLVEKRSIRGNKETVVYDPEKPDQEFESLFLKTYFQDAETPEQKQQIRKGIYEIAREAQQDRENSKYDEEKDVVPPYRKKGVDELMQTGDFDLGPAEANQIADVLEDVRAGMKDGGIKPVSEVYKNAKGVKAETRAGRELTPIEQKRFDQLGVYAQILRRLPAIAAVVRTEKQYENAGYVKSLTVSELKNMQKTIVEEQLKAAMLQEVADQSEINRLKGRLKNLG